MEVPSSRRYSPKCVEGVFCELRIQNPAYRSLPEALRAAIRALEASSDTAARPSVAKQASERPPRGSQEALARLPVLPACDCCPPGALAARRLCDEPPHPLPSCSSLLYD